MTSNKQSPSVLDQYLKRLQRNRQKKIREGRPYQYRLEMKAELQRIGSKPRD